jgi:xanthine dehydrogenase accessory factor
VRLHALHVLETGEPLLLRIEPGAGDQAASDGVVTVHNPCISGGALEIFLEPHLPKPLLRVIGDTPIATARAELGGSAGFHVAGGGDTTADDAAVVVASHGRDEEQTLAAALEAGVPYIGLVASRKRGPAVIEALEAEDRERIHTPAGLDIGARTPEEIALSILAELVATRRRPAAPPAPVEHHHHHCHE